MLNDNDLSVEVYDDAIDECLELPHDPNILAALHPRAFAVGELSVRSTRSSRKRLTYRLGPGRFAN